MSRLQGFEAAGPGEFRGIGLAYRIVRGDMAPTGDCYLWTIETPDGELLACHVEGLDRAVRTATAHALSR